MRTLTAYGHSWVRGSGATAPERGFVDLVARSFDLWVDNRGVSGTLSTQTAELVCRAAPPFSAAYLVMTGLNDSRLHGGSPRALGEYGSALDAILRALLLASPEATIAVVEQPRLLDYSGYAPHDRGTDELVDRFNDVLRQVVARSDRAVAVPVDGWDVSAMLDVDTVHPNDMGHAEIARAVAVTWGSSVRE